MVDKISVEIELEGGDEVNRQLEGVQQQGEKTFSGIQKAADQLDFSSVSDGFENVGNTGQEAFNKVKAAAQNAAVFEQIVQGVKKVEGAFEALGTAATRMATRMTKSLGLFGVLARSLGPVGIAAGVAAGALIKFGNDSAVALGQLTTQAAKLGLTAQQLDQLTQAFGKLSVSSDAVTSDLEKLKGLMTGGLFRLGDIAPPEATSGVQEFIAQLERMPDGVARTQLAMQTLGETLGGEVIAGLQTGSISAEKFAAALAGATPATQQQIVDAAKYQQSLNGLSNAWTQFKGEVAAPILTPILEWLTSQLPGIQAGIATTVREFQALWEVINTVASVGAQVIGALVAPVQLVADEVARLASTFAGWNWNPIAAGVQVWNDLIGVIQRAIDKVMEFIGLKPSGAGGGGGGAPGMAGGGLLGGRGTGTSDSNLAWVSRGEHIMPARAVQQPGVLSFLEALRRSGGDLSRVLNGMGRFALGGMVPRAIPAYAAGGLAGGGNNVTIQFPGLPAIGGLRASSNVVEQLQKAAALAQVRSGGRKPSRYS